MALGMRVRCGSGQVGMVWVWAGGVRYESGQVEQGASLDVGLGSVGCVDV